ncbi:MAG: DUF1127 domain-containing protein [Gammaproteobacteria bacterium]|nr:DUF1127 domain-containing protein [Gammaproteobacteria bacterium]
MTTHVAHLVKPRRVSLAGALDELTSGLRTWHARRAAIAELHRLPDHLLADIGLVRAGIPAAVDGMLKDRR